MSPCGSNKNQTQDLLNQLTIASPCPMLWSNMQVTEKEAVRFCGECKKNVYDVSKMTTLEAGILLQGGAHSGVMPCMQLYRRADGTVITDDCPVGLRRVRDQWRRLRATAAAALAIVFGSLLPVSAEDGKDGKNAKGAKDTSQCAPANQQTRGRPAINVLRGEPMPLGGAPQPLGGKPTMPKTDTVTPVLGGLVAPTDWQAMALKNASVKKLFDELQAFEGKGNLNDKDQAKAAEMRLKLAQAAEKNNVPRFAQSQLVVAEGQAKKINGNSALLKSILQARLKNAKLLKQSDVSEIESELQKLK